MGAALVAGGAVYLTGLAWLGLLHRLWRDAALPPASIPSCSADIVKAMLAALVFPAVWKWVEGGEAR